ncbi:MAG: haloacid dehalogenase-like hydrolase [Puniceicoccales bacterium]|jgi:phosphoserine phosphatase|nr:haloacid dehalogenase-like hydrolase [Puniceicoccales bacterium]
MACIWDFDKTLIPGYMQRPLFETYVVDEQNFWKEVGALSRVYRQQNIAVTEDLLYLNHLLTYVKTGPFRGLSNQKLQQLGTSLIFFEGLPTFFQILKDVVEKNERFNAHELKLEHYIISGGLAEMIRGSKIAPYVDDIFGCEFIEEPMLPGFLHQEILPIDSEYREISQIARVIDNTTKTRFLFEINKGVNKHANLDVNASMLPEDRRIPIKNMIYIADGATDVPMFSVMKERGGKTFAVHHPDNMQEFMQNDALLESGRVDCYGPADYCPGSLTYRWLTMHVEKIAERIVQDRENLLQSRIHKPPAFDSENQAGHSKQISLFTS